MPSIVRALAQRSTLLVYSLVIFVVGAFVFRALKGLTSSRLELVQ
jgi:hypothetical protein